MTLVVDGQNIAYAMNMTRELSTSYGMPTHAILGFIRTLGNVCQQFSSRSIFVTWDGGRSKDRTDLYPGYKANRDKLVEDPGWLKKRQDLDKQIDHIRILLQKLGVNQIWGNGVEGDDVIAMIVQSNKKNKKRSVIVSGDKDFLQLVDNDVEFFNPINNGSKAKHVTLGNFKEVMGLETPGQYLDFKSMVGDKSDGIPGCNGVGEKTAFKIIGEWGSYDAFREEVVNGRYDPPSIEMKAVVDEKGFRMSKKLMDLNSPMIPVTGANDWMILNGEAYPEVFVKYVEDLEIRSGKTMLELFKTVTGGVK